MKSRQFLSLAVLCGLSNFCTMGMDGRSNPDMKGNNQDLDYIEKVINETSIDNIKNLPKLLPYTNAKSESQKEDCRILRHLSEYPSSSDLYSKIMEIIELQKSPLGNDGVARLISELRSDIDGLIAKKLTNGKNKWNMMIVPRKGYKCIIPLNLYEFELNKLGNEFSKRKKEDTFKDSRFLYLEFDLPKNLDFSYLSGTILIPSFEDINSEVSVQITLEGKKTIPSRGNIYGKMANNVLGWWNLRKIRNKMYN